MKKLVAISVLFAGLATAVFAQDGGWSNAWKLGLSTTFTTDILYTQHASGKEEQTRNTTPVDGSGAFSDGSATFAKDGTGTWSEEYGKYAKGMTHFFPNSEPISGGKSRVFLSLANTGENYNIYFTITSPDVVYGTWADGDGGKGMKVGDFLLKGDMEEDWGIVVTPGIFRVSIGSKFADTAFVDQNAPWGATIGQNATYRFGVWRKDSGYLHSDHFRSMDTWGHPFTAGVALGDSFRFTLGYRLNPFFTGLWQGTTNSGWDNGEVGFIDNSSSANGAIMFSGSPADAIAFDLFYAINGKDANTFSREAKEFGYNDPTRYWRNLLGAYVQVKGIENLNLSFGYTASFNVYETAGYLCSDGDFTQSKSVTYNAPIYSGIDLRLGYSGIDKVGLKFNNNFSFAGVNGDKVEEDTSATSVLHTYVYKEKINLLLDEKEVLKPTGKNAGDGLTQGWFHWHSVLNADLNFFDGIGLDVGFMNDLDVTTNKLDKSVTKPVTGTTILRTDRTESNNTVTNNIFRAAVGVKYPVGNVSLKIALYLILDSTLIEEEKSITTTRSDGGTPQVVKTTQKKNDDVLKFGIPITFSVSF